jgi:hypothetical protein
MNKKPKDCRERISLNPFLKARFTEDMDLLGFTKLSDFIAHLWYQSKGLQMPNHRKKPDGEQ